MKIEYFKEFLVVSRLSSFTIAAAELFMTQSTLSRHITALEDDLGEPLFYQVGHKVKLTEAGQLAQPVFEAIVTNYEMLKNKIEQQITGMHQVVKLGLTASGAENVISPFLKMFLTEYPKMQIHISYYEHGIEEQILSGNIDMGEVVLMDNPLYNKLSSVYLYHLYHTAMMLKTHPFAEKTDLSLEDIALYKIILIKQDTAFNYMIRKLFADHDLTPEYIYSDHLFSIILTMRQYGGIFITRSNYIDFTSKDIVTKPINHGTLYLDYALAFRADNDNPSIPLLCHYLQNHIDKNQI